MDLCTGGELFFLLNRVGKFPESSARFYFAQLLLAVEYLHENRIMYRDLKPENVLIDVDGHVKLADFGLCKRFERNHARSFSFCGSPEYMSPEMLVGEGHDFRVDLYSLGAILFEMLTGLPPFYSADTRAMYAAILSEELDFPSYLSSDAVALLSALLHKEAACRLGSVTELKRHPWLAEVQWEALARKEVSPPWVPDMNESNFDPEYTELPASLGELPMQERSGLASRRGTEFWKEKRSPAESLWTSRTVTEQSYVQSFVREPPSAQKSAHSSIIKSRVNPSQFTRIESQASIEVGCDGPDWRLLKGFSFYGQPPEEVELVRVIQKQLGRQRQNKTLRYLQEKEARLASSGSREPKGPVC